jgi:hypothetical protein
MKILAVLFFLFNILAYAQPAGRIDGSPYPVSQKPDTLFVINDNNFTDAQLLTVQTLQGILAQTKPRIYRVRGDGYPTWLNDLKNNYGVITNYMYQTDLRSLLAHFKNEINGYILTDGTQPSVDVAISLAGLKHSIVVYGTVEQIAKNAGIPLLVDVTNENYQQFVDSCKGQMNKNLLCYNSVDKITFLSDYSTFGKMYYFFDDITSSLSDEILSQMNPNAPLLGWATDEYSLVNTVSKKGMVVHASDYALNLSTLSNVSAETKQQQHNTNPEVIKDVHTVCFLMSDGDNFSWLVNDFYPDPKWFGSTSRTKINLGWTLAPSLCELAPSLMKRFYDNAGTVEGGRDYFVAGPSGYGYAYPEAYTHLNDFVDLTARYMKKADQRILNIIGNSIDSKYLFPFMQQDQIDAIIYYYFSDYAGGKGSIAWVNDKPVITGRYQLWTGQTDSAESLAQKINSLPTDITSSKGYSLIPVHVWQNTVGDVAKCISLLNKNVRVVPPDEFVALIKKNIVQMVNVLQFSANNNTTEQKYLVPGDTGTAHNTTKRWANYNDKIIYKFNLDSLLVMSNGSKDLFAQFSVGNEYIVSASNSIDSAWSVVSQWSADTTVHVHNLLNMTTVTSNLRKYYDLGWHEVYIKLEDGIKADAYGVSLFSVTITQPKTFTDVDETTGNIPTGFKLNQNYPNPFNPSTRITYQIPNAGYVTLRVYDVLGREVSTLINSEQNSGSHEVMFDGSKLSSGIYFFRLQSGNYAATNKMVLMK